MKKKYSVPSQDKKDWFDFTKTNNDVGVKEDDFTERNDVSDKIPKLDLHGYSLDKANQMVKKFIIDSFNIGYKKLLIITGKGSRSKYINNPYVSEKLSKLKYSVPDYIQNDKNLSEKIKKISTAKFKEGGDGAVYVFLKNKNKF